ncbi:MAG: hypothetical protein JWQ26_5 [Modestobacter sp.]|jgi:hypothetical protein|nr:hypothetical protein [Modestobacter sp.]HEV7726779.1 hypothetical protein [Modestobacter sp.]
MSGWTWVLLIGLAWLLVGTAVALGLGAAVHVAEERNRRDLVRHRMAERRARRQHSSRAAG